MNRTFDAKDSLALLLTHQQHIHDNIKFADQKAVALIGINGALLGVIFPLISFNHPLTIGLGIFTCLPLTIAIGLAVWVLKPRGQKNIERGQGVIDPVRIAQFTLDDYLKTVHAIDHAALINELHTFIYDRAKIDEKKYYYLTLSLVCSVSGWLVALVLAINAKVYGLI